MTLRKICGPNENISKNHLKNIFCAHEMSKSHKHIGLFSCGYIQMELFFTLSSIKHWQ